MSIAHVQAVALQNAYPRGANQVRVPILFEVDIARTIDEERTPFELCIVLDRSGSMAGAKMRDALFAVNQAIDNLGEGDMLHLVTFSNVATTVFTQGTRQRASELHAAVARIIAEGSTNTYAAMAQAKELLQRSGATDRNKRIFLISDGHASGASTTPQDLCNVAQEALQCGIIVTTFGIGGDIHEEMMKAIAASGHGSYFFLRTTIIRQTIEGEMSSLVSTLGTEASIRVSSMLPAGQLTCVHRPMNMLSDDETANSSLDHDHVGSVWLGDLHLGNRKQSLIECKVCVPEVASEGDTLDVIHYEFKYRCAISHELVHISGAVHVVVGTTTDEVPRVRVADEMSRLCLLQEDLRRFIEQRRLSEASELQDRIMHDLERIQALDDLGFVDAALRRLRRIAERLNSGALSHVQAGLMLGEALERHAEGDIMHVSSFASVTPALHPRSVSESSSSFISVPVSFHDPVLRRRCRRRHFFRRFFRRVFPCFVSSRNHGPVHQPESPRLPRILRRDAVSIPHVRETPAISNMSNLQPPAFLLADGFDVSSLPAEFLCPITHEPMTEPVVARDGHTYERKAITYWIEQGGRTSPKTGETLHDLTLTPNHALRAQIMTENDRQCAASAAIAHPFSTV
mmetsp:Transcript_53406/g.83156  ORF Transcript_53406/g.83156 Transcript_53406/m.83156 type:complete len:629 (+) Transcript_53406:57-1943(+)